MAPDDETQSHESDAIGALIAAGAERVQAPDRLRARLAQQQAQRTRSGPGRLRWPLPALSALTAALAIALVLVLAGVDDHGAGAPSLETAVALALAPPTAPAPPVDPRDPRVVGASEGGIAFPNYGYERPDWRTTGLRRDRLGDRRATTIVYRGPRGAVGYTIVDGAPLAVPRGARPIPGSTFWTLRRGDATILTWRRDGHTCVLATRDARLSVLEHFARGG
jgi:hypothetical protein